MTTTKKPEEQIRNLRDLKGGPIYATDATRSRAVRLFEEVCKKASGRGFHVTVSSSSEGRTSTRTGTSSRCTFERLSMGGS